MADPTEAEIRLMADYVILALEEVRELAEEDATNLLGIEGELVEAVKGDFAPGILAGWSRHRSLVSSALSSGIARTLLDAIMLSYGKLINSPLIDPVQMFRRDIYQHYVDNSYTVTKRGFTFGSASAGGSNVGDGTVNRLNVDANGHDIDLQTADVKTIECISDEHSGAREHQEMFRIQGQARTLDFMSLRGGTGQPGTVPVSQIRALSCQDSKQFLLNPSFSTTALSFSGGLATIAAVSDVTSWTLDGTTDVQLDRNIYYRDSENETNPTSLRFNGNRYIQQNLNVRRAQVDFTSVGGLGQDLFPLYIQIAYYRESSADGTLTLTFGDQSVNVNVSTASDDAWSILRIALGTGNWYPNWIKEDPLVKVQLASNTTGAVLIDDVIVAPFTRFDGGWYAIVGGATPFLRDDVFTCTDTVTEGGDIQKWFVRAGYGYLPSTASTPTWGDPPPTPTPTPTPSPTPTPTP